MVVRYPHRFVLEEVQLWSPVPEIGTGVLEGGGPTVAVTGPGPLIGGGLVGTAVGSGIGGGGGTVTGGIVGIGMGGIGMGGMVGVGGTVGIGSGGTVGAGGVGGMQEPGLTATVAPWGPLVIWKQGGAGGGNTRQLVSLTATVPETWQGPGIGGGVTVDVGTGGTVMVGMGIGWLVRVSYTPMHSKVSR
ncbi:MAG: hypothetical protein ABR507_10000 [Actinomycetota bacterium]